MHDVVNLLRQLRVKINDSFQHMIKKARRNCMCREIIGTAYRGYVLPTLINPLK